MFGSLFKARMVTAEDSLPGRDEVMPIEHNHVVLGNPFNETPLGHEVVVFGMGCFWGAARFFWKMDGVYSTSVGYAGGVTKTPT